MAELKWTVGIRFDGEGCGGATLVRPDASVASQIMFPFCWESLAAWGEADARQ